MKLEKQNMSLRHRIFLLLLAVGLASFIIAGAVSLAGMYAIRENIDKTGALLADNTASFTENFAEMQVKRRLSSDAAATAKLIRHEMKTTMDDARYIAELMSKMLKHPELYHPRRLLDPHTDVIPSGKAYVNFSRELVRQYGAGAYASEIALVSNIADDLELMPEWYTAAFAGSAHGYLIAMDVTPDKSAKQFSPAFLESYDPRKMGWYKLAADGLFRLTDNADTVDKLDQDQDITKAEQSRFLLDNATGSVIFSTFTDGPLAVPQSVSDLRQSPEKSIARAATAMVAGQKDVMLVTVGGEDYYLAFAPVDKPGWSYGILNNKRAVVYPAAYARDNVLSQMESFAEMLHSSFRSSLRWALLIFLLMLAPLFFVSSEVARRFVTPILALIEGVKRIAQGNLDEKVDVRRTDELALLADSVNDMAGDLKKHIETLSKVTAEKERIATELSVATDIQEGMLPRNFGEIAKNKGFDLFATMAAAKEVGGDFYDFYMLDDRRLVITIADVSGKGVPAALFMVIAKTILKNSALSAGEEETFADVIRRANQQLCENNEEMLFVTVFFGVLDIRTGDFTYVNCGHNPPLLRQGTDGAFTYLRPAKKNLMMGVEEDLRFTQERLQMSPGSLLFCYTDGVTEAMNEAGEVYSEGQLQADLTGIPSGNGVPVADVLAALRKDITAHAGGAEQSDDITMLAIRYTG